MSHPTAPPHDSAGPPANRAGIWVFIIAGLAIMLATITSASLRLAALLGDSPASFTSDLAGTGLTLTAQDTDVTVDRASFTLDSVPSAVLAPAIIEQVVLVLTTAAVIFCLIELARATLRGRIFSQANTRFVATAAITGLVGYGLAPAIGSIAAHEAAFHAELTESLSPSLFAVHPFPFVMAAFAASIVISAYAVGDRLQRDTEGLV